MIDYGYYVILAVYFVLLAIWSALLIFGNARHSAVLTEKYLPRQKYPLRELIAVGLVLAEVFRFQFNSKADLKKTAQLRGVYGEKGGVFYYRVNVAERLAFAALGGLLGLLVPVIAGEYLFILASPALAALGYILAMGGINDLIQDREKELMKQFPNMVSNLALLIGSGMDTYNAWEIIGRDGEGLLYKEMRETIKDMETQGTSEIQAYVNFGKRCAVPRITKFISMMIQNIRKGSDDLITFLAYESSLCWEEKKSSAKIQGEKAGNKLMIPIFMIMIGILVLIGGPLISNIGF